MYNGLKRNGSKFSSVTFFVVLLICQKRALVSDVACFHAESAQGDGSGDAVRVMMVKSLFKGLFLFRKRYYFSFMLFLL